MRNTEKQNQWGMDHKSICFHHFVLDWSLDDPAYQTESIIILGSKDKTHLKNTSNLSK